MTGGIPPSRSTIAPVGMSIGIGAGGMAGAAITAMARITTGDGVGGAIRIRGDGTTAIGTATATGFTTAIGATVSTTIAIIPTTATPIIKANTADASAAAVP